MFIGAKLIIFHLLERWALSFRISTPICPIMSTRRYGILYLVFVEVSVTVWGSYICFSMCDLLVDIKHLRVKEFMEPALLLEETIFLLLLQLPGGTVFLYLVFVEVSVKVWGFYICLSMYELLVDMKHSKVRGLWNQHYSWRKQKCYYCYNEGVQANVTKIVGSSYIFSNEIFVNQKIEQTNMKPIT